MTPNRRKNNLYTINHGKITHSYDHATTKEIVDLIVTSSSTQGLPFCDLFWGIHRIVPPIKRNRPRIGVQTEQLYDQLGDQMWRQITFQSLIKKFLYYDRIIDINPTNWRAYQNLPKFLKQRVIVGPYIFPSEPCEYKISQDGYVVFFGSLNERRQRIISELQRLLPVKVVPKNTYGVELDEHIGNATAILNIHYADGVYSEYPRILKAVLSGKVLISDELDSNLKANMHYIYISNNLRRCDITIEKTRTIFTNMSSYLSSKYSFREGLIRCFGV